MSLATPSPAFASSGPRGRGAAIVLVCVGGFLLGQVLAQAAAVIVGSLAGSHVSYHELFTMSEPPWWFILSNLAGLWLGWGISVAYLQGRYRVIEPSTALRFRLADLGGIPLAFAMQLVIARVYAPFHPHDLSRPTHRIFGGSSGPMLVVVLAVTVFVVPAAEEFFFRGALLPGLRDLTKSSQLVLSACLAIGIDGILFGLAHGELIQLPALAAVGVVLAWQYWNSGRLWSNYVTHASFNAFAVVAYELSRGVH